MKGSEGKEKGKWKGLYFLIENKWATICISAINVIHGLMSYQQDHYNGESISILTDKKERNINRTRTDREY